jgi:O-Antigen ligase
MGIVIFGAELNSPISVLTSIQSQNITLLLIVMLGAISIGMYKSNRNDAITALGHLWVASFIVILIFPTIGFLANFESSQSADYLFWFKRAALIIAIMSIGHIGLVLKSNHIFVTVHVIYFITICAVAASIFFPAEFISYIDENDPMLLAGLNPVGGGFQLNPNGSAFALICGYLCILGVRLGSGQTHKGIWTIVIDASVIIATAATSSRSGFICASIIVGAVFVSNIKKSRNIAQSLTAIATIIVATTLVLSTEILQDFSNLERIFNTKHEGAIESNEARLSALRDSVTIIGQSPLIGVGPVLRQYVLHVQPHNMYISYAIDAGLILGMSYPLYLLYLYVSLRHYLLSSFLPALVAGTLVTVSFFDHQLIYSKQFAYLYLVLIYLCRINLTQSPKK